MGIIANRGMTLLVRACTSFLLRGLLCIWGRVSVCAVYLSLVSRHASIRVSSWRDDRLLLLSGFLREREREYSEQDVMYMYVAQW